MNDSRHRFSDLLEFDSAGTPFLPAAVHPMEELLNLSPEQVLLRFKESQRRDFSELIQGLHQVDNPLHQTFSRLRSIAEAEGGNPFLRSRLFDPDGLNALFLDLHSHVMDHPVWRHPFFVRIFEGRFNDEQLKGFALHYFNQIKNTRQCVALALGRFNGLMEMPYGQLNERLSEMTQIVLAQLLADEYGVGSHELDDYPSLGALFGAQTHIVIYRKLFDGLKVEFQDQDVPMLHGVADNVLIQRLVAGDPRFTPLESLASVGLGMEWGVPEFFSLLLGGIVRWAWRHHAPLTREHLQVFIAHVRYDVLHAIAVMMVTSIHIRSEEDIEAIKQATNTLMAGRYGMMSDLYRHLFGEPCADLNDARLEVCYQLRDRRIEAALRQARSSVAEGRVVDGAAYRQRIETPFVFHEGC